MIKILKHFLMLTYIYLYIIIHFEVYLFINYQRIENPITSGGYFWALLLIILLPIIGLYSVYQWLYLKKLKQNRRLLSILFLELFIIIEAILAYKNMVIGDEYSSPDKNGYLLLIGSGMIVAFIMGWILDMLMRRLFRNNISEAKP